jgi:hypothetical protein
MNKKIENDIETPKEEESKQEYSVIKDFVNKDDMKTYRVGTKTFLVTERAKTLSDLGYINAIPTTTI